MRKAHRWVIAAVLVLGLTGCQKNHYKILPLSEKPKLPAAHNHAVKPATHNHAVKPATKNEAPKPTVHPVEAQPAAPVGELRAVAHLSAKSGSRVAGDVLFVERHGKVTIHVSVTGLKPGEHGLHIHDKGDCSAPDAKSAGGHFNPTNMPHGAPSALKHHAGDLGNIVANASGRASLTMTVDDITLGPGKTSIVGRSIVIHRGKDDLKSQPSGNAGPRVACGVIEMMKIAPANRGVPTRPAVPVKK